MRFNKAYVEITNMCNLACPFCHGTGREKRFITVPDFKTAAERLRPFTEYIYLHLMGEPLLHPSLGEILDVCASLGFKVSVTTNGTMLREKTELLMSSAAMYKISVSLHSFEVNPVGSLRGYLNGVCAAAFKARANGILFSMRLWNEGGDNVKNGEIKELLSEFFPPPHKENRCGITLADGVFLEYGVRFEWPDADGCAKNVRFCKGLRDQIGVLCDGTVVPCCLDAEGDIALGNIFTDDLNEILSSDRARSIINGFSEGRAAEKLCRTCGFAENRFG